MKIRLSLITLFGLALAYSATAAEQTATSSSLPSESSAAPTSTTSVVAPAVTEVFGKLELRPTWSSNAGSIEAQNSIELGYQFNPDLKLLYNQSFNVDLYRKGTTNVGMTFPDARIELDVNNLWRDSSRQWSVDVQPRVHLPTDIAKRDNGFITALKTQVNLNRKVSDQLAFQLSAGPTFFAYSQTGGTFEKAPAANPVFENTFEFATTYSFSRQLKLGVPLKFGQTRYMRYVPTARFHDRWTYGVSIKPELTYAVSRNVVAGLAFETASLVSDDLGRLTVGDGFRKALTQLVLVATL